MNLPDETTIEAMHRRQAMTGEAFELVWRHCRVVRDIALELAPPDADVSLVEAGALVHDIGVYQVFAERDTPYICHGVLGEDLLAEQGYPELLTRFASHHTGVGITKEQIAERRLPLPERDYLAETLEEELVMYADKFHSKSRPPTFLTYDAYARQVAAFGPGNAERFEQFRARFGIPDIESLAQRYGHAIRR